MALSKHSLKRPRVGGGSISGLLPNVGPATFSGNLSPATFSRSLSITGALYAGSLETGHALLTPAIVVASSADLAIRNYGNAGGLSISNTAGAVTFADSLKLGGGRMFEHNNGSFRALLSA